MRIFFLITVACLWLSCSTSRKLKVVKYPMHEKGRKLTFKIPKGYSFSHVGWESTDDVYKYEDSSLIYFTDRRGGGVNHNNIKEAGKLDSLFYIQISEEDTLILSGVDKRGLLWKNYAFKEYSIGYKNVKSHKKAEFDKVVNSIRIK